MTSTTSSGSVLDDNDDIVRDVDDIVRVDDTLVVDVQTSRVLVLHVVARHMTSHVQTSYVDDTLLVHATNTACNWSPPLKGVKNDDIVHLLATVD